jgi:hypothetical protein
MTFESMAYDTSLGRAAPTVLIISDNTSGANAARQSIEATGCRLIAELNTAEARGRLAEQVALDVVMFECAHTPAATLTSLIDDLRDVGTVRQTRALVNTRAEDLDACSGLLGSDHVTLLCAADVADRIVGLKLATLPQSFTLNDSATDIESMRLQRLADEVGRIAKTLASLSGTGRAGFQTSPEAKVNDAMMSFRTEPSQLGQTGEGPTAAELRNVIRMRRMRDQFFANDLFADPAWDMLLDLLAARLECVQVAVSSLCIAAAVPPTTALRWIKTMCDNGLFDRIADPDDGRRIFIRLSDTATDAMFRYWQLSERYQTRML